MSKVLLILLSIPLLLIGLAVVAVLFLSASLFSKTKTIERQTHYSDNDDLFHCAA